MYTLPLRHPRAHRPSGAPVVGVLAPVGGGFYHGRILAGIGAAVGAGGGQVVLLQVLDAGLNGDVLPFDCDDLRATAFDQVDALVVVPGAACGRIPEVVAAAGIPVVTVSQQLAGSDGPVVSADNLGGVTAAVRHLIDHQHRAIGFVGPLGLYDGEQRFGAYRGALELAGLAPIADAVIDTGTGRTEPSGALAARKLVAAGVPVTAVVCATDRIALGLLGELEVLGIRVPEDLAVVGFDDIERSAYLRPSLSTVNQRFEVIGRRSGDLALRLAAGERGLDGAHLVPAQFVTRESCGCGQAVTHAGEEPPAREDVAATVLRLLDPPALAIELRARIRVALDVLLRRLDQAVAGEPDVDLSRPASDFAAVVCECEPSPETSRKIQAALTAHLASGPGVDRATAVGAAVEIVNHLWRRQASTHLDRRTALEVSLWEQYEIGVEVMDSDDDGISLDWMEQTRVVAGCLATWVGGPDSGRLRIGAFFERDGRAAGRVVVGDEVPLAAFPPRAVIDLADPEHGIVTYVIPVRSGGSDFGFLVVVGSIDTTSSTGREPYSQWASLITEAFERDAMHERIRASEERYSLAAAATNDGLWDWELDSDRVYFSDRCNDLLGCDAPGGVGPPDRWLRALEPADAAMFRDLLDECRHERATPFELEQRIVDRRTGERRTVLVRGLPVSRGGRRRVVGSLADIEPRKQLEARLRYGALYDSVTGLPNREHFLERLAESIEAATHGGARYAVVFLDLDGFKLVNDSLGHLAGDELLVAIAERLRRCARSTDVAARFGGDEFAVLFDDLSFRDVTAVVDRMRAEISAPVALDGHEVQVTASFGIALSDNGYKCAEDVLRDADLAMYRAKSTGRGSCTVFDVEMHAAAVTRLGLLAELRLAFDRDEFELVYQPIFDACSGDVAHLEALVRWRRPGHGLTAPGAFLPALVESGHMVRLGHLVVDMACRQLREWSTAGLHARVSVNVSHAEFWDQRTIGHIVASCARYGLDPDQLVVEITEDIIAGQPEHAVELMDQLRGGGFELHIDDFGIGSSSLHALYRYPVNGLKVDRSFVSMLGQDERMNALVRSIIEMGNALGMETIAEGVEYPEQIAQLVSLGCEKLQGYALARPMSADAVASLLRPHAADEAVTLPLGRP